MKKLSCSSVLTLCIVLCLILIVGCSNANEETNTGENTDWELTKYKTINDLEGVTMSVKKGTVTTTELTVVFDNNSGKQCIYGEYFLLEKKMEGSWYQVPVTIDGNYGFNSIGHGLETLNVSEWTVDWNWLYGRLVTGEYRIVKDILDFRKAGDYDTYFLAAEFTIN
ncbi:hypothetical protein BK120_09755 [Paenibacillus sp. FSL A5-0031]|uniref:immunoglobulin-like domain-containing protein n=1 Tax=Paenibacillus sp. FSL A5-0031 TaxID=1920420 RepID=UPI00096E1608|nr:immunoglobulin-like domain-containing protein [Paenibacillus sp. FSL A5-0031]OME86239.1 hypothetical protein BK120_09755 [Paenibacillus sp. FSL A5-0031]